MLRTMPAAALAGVLLAAPVASRGSDLDLRCTETDRALSERLRVLLVRDLPASQAGVHDVMSRMGLARIDCKRGRAERGLRVYAAAAAGLAELEAVDAAFMDSAAVPADPAPPQ